MGFFDRHKKIDLDGAVEARFQKQMDDALAKPEVGEKLSALARLNVDIDRALNDKLDEIEGEAKGKRHLPMWGGNTAQILATLTAGAFINPLFLLGVIPGAFGVSYLSNKRVDAAKKRLIEENAEFIKGLATQKTAVAEIIDRILEDNTTEVAESARRDFLFEKYPEIKSRFATVAARKMASKDAPPSRKPDDDRPFRF